MDQRTSESAARNFVACINRHDVAEMMELCSSKHTFTDSMGVTLSGSEALAGAWHGYFAVFPDYRIEIDTVATAGSVVLMAGWASGSLRGKGSLWRIPAAWRADVVGGQVSAWQVYADNKPVYDILAHDT